MKHILLTVLLLVSVATSNAEPSLMVGAGANLTTISGSDSLVTSSSLKLGGVLRIGFEQTFSDHFSLVTGFSLEGRGEKNESKKNLTAEITQTMSEQTDMLFLQIPIQAQVNIPFGIFRLSVFAGPELGIFLDGEKKRSKKVSVQTTTEKDTIDFSRDIRMLDYGVNFGAGFEINTGDVGAVFLRPGYYLGLADLLEQNKDAEINTNLAGKNSSIYCYIGYRLNIPKKD